MQISFLGFSATAKSIEEIQALIMLAKAQGAFNAPCAPVVSATVAKEPSAPVTIASAPVKPLPSASAPMREADTSGLTATEKTLLARRLAVEKWRNRLDGESAVQWFKSVYGHDYRRTKLESADNEDTEMCALRWMTQRQSAIDTPAIANDGESDEFAIDLDNRPE